MDFKLVVHKNGKLLSQKQTVITRKRPLREPIGTVPNDENIKQGTGDVEMLSAWRKPLSEKEKVMVGRWKEIQSDDPKHPAFSILRTDRSYTYLFMAPLPDSKGTEFKPSLIHGLWRLQGGQIHYLDLLIDGKKCDYEEVVGYNLATLSPDFFLLRSKPDGNGRPVQIKGSRLRKFTEPEMLPYNAPNALKGFDLGWNYLTAKGANDPTAEDDGASTPDQGGEVPTHEVADALQESISNRFQTILQHEMLAACKEQLSEKERQMVGRWKEIKSNDPTNPAFSIMREDRSSTYFSAFPVLDSDGVAIPGKFENFISHGLWRIDGNRLYLYDFVSDGEKSDWLLLSELAFMSPKGFSYRVMNDGPDLFVHKAVRLKKFSVPEMHTYNASDALKGFDLAQPIERQKERERNWQRSSLA